MINASVKNQHSETQTDSKIDEISSNAFSELFKSMHAALETYSNVHRGSGHFSLVTTHLYEKAREIVLDYLGIDKLKFTVIFCTPARASNLAANLKKNTFKLVASSEIGLPLAIVAIAVDKKEVPKGVPFETGGGTTTLISRNWVDWANTPDKFEAGTPAIINVIAFAKALLLVKKYGNDIFRGEVSAETIFELLYNDEFHEYTGKALYYKLQESIIGNDINVPTAFGLQTFINLDHSASTQSTLPVWEAFHKALRQPDSIKAQLINEVKAVCEKFFNAPDDKYDIIFTSNTTESVNVISRDIKSEEGIEPVIVNSYMEHSSNELPWRFANGCSLIRFNVDELGYFDLKGLEEMLIEYNSENKHGSKRIRLVAVTGASNVLGVCNDIKPLSKLTKKYNVKLLIDAAQLIAHREVNMADSDIDFLVFSAHKIYAPFGTGGLISRKGLLDLQSEHLKSAITSGEENIGGITALGKSLLLLQRIGMDVIADEENQLCAKTLKGMSLIPNMKLFGIKDPESKDFSSKIGVIPFSFSNLYGDKIAYQLAMFGGIGIRFGCHCAHLIVKRLANLKPFLEPIQRLIIRLFPNLKLPGVARVSIGLATTEKDIDRLLDTLNLISKKDKVQLEKLPAVKAQIEKFIEEREKLVY